MRMSLELIVIAIVILVVAVVILTIFTGGISNFNNVFSDQSSKQIEGSMCVTACSQHCLLNPDDTNDKPDLKVIYKDTEVSCYKYIKDCQCKKPTPALPKP